MMKSDMIVTEKGNEMTSTIVVAKNNKEIIIGESVKTINEMSIIHHDMIVIVELIESQTTDTDEIVAVQESVSEIEVRGIVVHL